MNSKKVIAKRHKTGNEDLLYSPLSRIQSSNASVHVRERYLRQGLKSTALKVKGQGIGLLAYLKLE